MQRIVIAVAILAATGTVHAMGSDIDEDLLAWNPAGSAALFRQRTARDGDTSTSYWIANGGTTASISMTIRINGKDVEQITVADCKAAANRLVAGLAAGGFIGVTVVPAACAQPGREIIRTTAAIARDVEQSWVPLPQGRTETARESASWQVAKQVAPDYVPFTPFDSCSNQAPRTLDLANKTGALILVITANRCNTPIKTRVSAFTRTGATYTAVKL